MIIVLKPGSSEADIEDISRRVGEMGFKTHLSQGEVRTIVGVVGEDRAKEQLLALQSLDCGLIIEVHNNPAEALSDGPQSLKPDRFAALMAELRPLAQILGRSL